MTTPESSNPPPAIPGLTYVQPLGSGGYADVHLYRQQLPERPVAVKVLRSAGLADRLREQFTAEANAMARLADHPNIVPVFSAAIAGDGRPYIVMSYYPNANLGVRAARAGFSVPDVLRIGVQIASAVETAHRAGILHRDIKPANILTNQYDTPGLTDFGIAAQAIAVAEETDTGVSVPWSPPEVLYATAPASARSDVYSLGATLWQLLDGRSPFEIPGGDNSTYALMARIRDMSPPSCSRPGVPESLDRVLRQAMAKKPESRPPTALQLARNLREIERELRLAQTGIVLPSVAIPVPQRTPDIGPAATRARSPVRVDPEARSTPGVTANRRSTALPRAPGPPGSAPVVSTVHRTAMIVAGTPGSDSPVDGRRWWPIVLVTSLVAIAAAVIGVALLSGGSQPVVSTSGGTNQDAGALGESEPPGIPVVTAKRTGAGMIRFTWTYSARLANDSYTWQTSDGKHAGLARAAELDLRDPRGVRLCVRVKVVRADGSNAVTDWSPAGCAN